ncbi:lisH domain-containing protein FOPNL isoform X2 [Cephus cinctus]|uniref:LisH domain-containing protein FOPNL isoform X2 n=1 Tax=Cephus cinctus TaxID=211228 RepID=A0AAJ7FPC8_CEPCN|nr:lisH domain-containing protein FOPNL isoform X2 [Cephus cinctus]
MATERDLTVRDSLETNGNLGRIRAEMRTEVMKLLDVSNRINISKRPCQPHNILLLNELIREYFNWIGYKYTCSVLTTECELSKQPFNHDFFMQSLGIKEYDKSNNLPLLLQLLETCKDVKNA